MCFVSRAIPAILVRVCVFVFVFAVPGSVDHQAIFLRLRQQLPDAVLLASSRAGRPLAAVHGGSANPHCLAIPCLCLGCGCPQSLQKLGSQLFLILLTGQLIGLIKQHGGVAWRVYIRYDSVRVRGHAFAATCRCRAGCSLVVAAGIPACTAAQVSLPVLPPSWLLRVLWQGISL